MGLEEHWVVERFLAQHVQGPGERGDFMEHSRIRGRNTGGLASVSKC